MKTGCTLLFLMLASTLQAQVKITGKITDYKGKPVGGVSISIRDSYDGTTSDSTGNFAFETTEKGKQVLEASITGYRPFEQPLTIGSSQIYININMRELITELKAVVISAGSFVASDKNKGAVLSALDIVTTPSANADITAAFKTLPGTQQVGESEGLFVRGGSANESKIYMDGNLVNNFFYSSTPGIATRGRFNPFLFKGTVFSSGGYSALYGQALSSVLVLESNDLPERTQADLGISVVGIGGGIQKLSKDKKSSWGFSYNYANLWLGFKVNPPKQDFYQLPEYHELDANFRFKTKRGGMVKFYAYLSANKTAFRNTDLDSSVLKNAFSLENFNSYKNINWRENFKGGWKLTAGLSYSNNKDDIANELQDGNNQKVTITNPSFYAFKNFNLANRANYAQARAVLEKKLGGLNAVRFGSDYFYSNEKSVYTLYDGNRFTDVVEDNLKAVFAETDIYITNDLAAKIGTRAEHSQIISKWNIAPRVSMSYKFKDNSQASLAYGLFYQNPERRILPAAASLDYSRAAHYILQYQKLSSDRTFRFEAFYKKYTDLYKTNVSQTGRGLVANNNGFGEAKGIEFFFRDKKTFKNVDYWISYSYLDTKRDYLNYPQAIQPPFATNHTAALVVKKFVLPWKTGFNLSYNFATGRPYYYFTYDNTQNKYVIGDAGTTINYNSMSFSVNYLPNLGKTEKKSFIVWVLGINNVLGQNQVFTYNYNSSGSSKFPVTPPSRRFVFVGCFLSFGIDRTQDAINNNL